MGTTISGAGTTISEVDNDGHKKLWCEHCKKPWHTKETCWKLHGKPANWKPKSKRDGCAYQATIEETQEPSTNSDAVPFTKEQLEHLYKLFQSPKLSLTLSCSLVQKGIDHGEDDWQC
ncbi:Calcineurin B-like protein [Actinidia chinensis var. chinensis]|uniref:Calcineurin B-like protein n=1 Tax=Actinidia chinensis var. chinensis TaxID=1590841 RepID=A0A2R6PC65_ACTCC|nr:Calcineurin B-like protein [Actinidia chinensis var. chinensis]